MLIDFDKESHIYFVDGEIASISVTELLSKHGISADYSGVPKAKMQASIERGLAVHEDIEKCFTEEKHEPTTDEAKAFCEWAKKNLSGCAVEQVLGLNYKGMRIAGTADILGITKKGIRFVGDQKTTAKINTESVRWQVSIYDYFVRKLGNEKVNGIDLSQWGGAELFYCFHYNKDGKLKPVVLAKVSDSEIERLFECEYNGEMYAPQELVVDNELAVAVEQAEIALEEINRAKELIERQVKGFREKLLSLFEEQGLLSWESPNGKVLVSYVHESESVRVDTAKLKSENPEIYKNVVKNSKIKSHLMVRFRGEEESERDNF